MGFHTSRSHAPDLCSCFKSHLKWYFLASQMHARTSHLFCSCSTSLSVGIRTFSCNDFLNIFSTLKLLKVKVRFYPRVYPNSYYCLSTQWALGKCLSMDWMSEKWSKDNSVVQPWDGFYGQSKVHHGFLQLPRSERRGSAPQLWIKPPTSEQTLCWAWLTCTLWLPVKLMWLSIALLTLMDISRKKCLSLHFWTGQSYNIT